MIDEKIKSGETYRYHYKEKLNVIRMIFDIMEKKIELQNEIPDLEKSILKN
jgi:hypothetical protein